MEQGIVIDKLLIIFKGIVGSGESQRYKYRRRGVCHLQNLKGETVKFLWGCLQNERSINHWFKENLSNWEYYSNNPIFPILHPELPKAYEAFFYEAENGSLWEGEYGQRRLQLVQIMINYLENLKQQEEEII